MNKPSIEQAQRHALEVMGMAQGQLSLHPDFITLKDLERVQARNIFGYGSPGDRGQFICEIRKYLERLEYNETIYQHEI